MKTEVIVQRGRIFSDPPERTREASRGIIIKDGKILLTYEKNTGVYMTPGGGLEENETLKECCKREIAEEAGYEIEVGEPFITVREYSFETLYISNYFLCNITGSCDSSLTEIEKEHGAAPIWIETEKAFEIFSEYDSKREDIRSLYLREFTVLNKLKDRGVL